MKTNLIIFLFTVFAAQAWSQSADYEKILSTLKDKKLITPGKVIAITIWSTDNEKSREANKAFDKAAKVFEFAKLKGGPRGFTALAVNFTDTESAADIAFNKDTPVRLLPLKKSEAGFNADQTCTNFVLDADGKLVYCNLDPENIFNSIQQLITR
jgi:hypothetical protein